MEFVVDINSIKQPTTHSEFEVQSFIYSELIRGGFNVFGEVKTVQKNKQGRNEVCRFDIAEFEQKKLAGIIEVKASIVTHGGANGWYGTRQGRRYSSFGVPIAIIYGIENAQIFVNQANKEKRIPYDKWAY